MPSKKATQAALAGNNLIIVLIVVSFVAVAVTVLVGKMLFSSIVLDQKILDAKSQADTKLNQDLANAPKLVEDYQALGAINRIVGDALPTTKDMPSILVTLENMGIHSGLKMKSVSPTASLGTAATAPAAGSSATSGANGVGVPNAQSYLVSVGFQGPYTGLVKFLNDIEMSVRPMKLLDLQLTGSGADLSGQATLMTYYKSNATLPIVMEDVK